MQLRNVHRVETPEFVVFEFDVAGLASRAAAYGIDFLVMAAIAVALFFASLLAGVTLRGFALAVFFVGAFLLQWGYFTVCEWRFSGRTVGKRLLGLRTIDEAGVRIDFFQALMRNLLRLLDALPGPYLVGLVTALLTTRRQRLGDLLAGTVVVCEARRPVPEHVVPPGSEYNSLLEDPVRRESVRRVVDPRLRELMVSAALRRERLGLSARIELFARLASELEARGVVRPSALSDERFVLSATAALLRSGSERR